MSVQMENIIGKCIIGDPCFIVTEYVELYSEVFFNKQKLLINIEH